MADALINAFLSLPVGLVEQLLFGRFVVALLSSAVGDNPTIR